MGIILLKTTCTPYFYIEIGPFVGISAWALPFMQPCPVWGIFLPLPTFCGQKMGMLFTKCAIAQCWKLTQKKCSCTKVKGQRLKTPSHCTSTPPFGEQKDIQTCSIKWLQVNVTILVNLAGGWLHCQGLTVHGYSNTQYFALYIYSYQKAMPKPIDGAIKCQTSIFCFLVSTFLTIEYSKRHLIYIL